MSRFDLRDRVTIASTGALALGLILLSVAINLLLANRLDSDATRVLRNRAEAQLSTLETKDGVVKVRETANDAALDEQSWIFAGGKRLAYARASTRVEALVNEISNVSHPTERSIDDDVRLLALPAYANGSSNQIGTVVVGVSLLPYDHTERVARIGTILMAIFVLLASALIVRRSVGQALQPVEQMTRRARDWSERDLHRRFELGPPVDELTGLAATLDSLLGKIEATLRREQRLSAEIAHELRTPLAGIKAEAELALREDRSSSDRDLPLHRVVAGVDRMNTAIETILAAARSDDGSGHACDPVEAVAVAFDATRSVASAAGVELVSGGEAGAMSVDVDQKLLIQTIAPVLENAVRHATGKVTVEFSRANGHATIAVVDDGPGVASDAVEAIFQPGISTVNGAGLGLPLAMRLAQSCGGELRAVPREHGGRFELELPAPPEQRSE